MIAGMCADIRPLIGDAVIRGGHVRVRLEDAPLGTPMGNLAWVEEAVRILRDHGAEPASAAEMRQALTSIADAADRIAFRRSGIESPDYAESRATEFDE